MKVLKIDKYYDDTLYLVGCIDKNMNFYIVQLELTEDGEDYHALRISYRKFIGFTPKMKPRWSKTFFLYNIEDKEAIELLMEEVASDNKLIYHREYPLEETLIALCENLEQYLPRIKESSNPT